MKNDYLPREKFFKKISNLKKLKKGKKEKKEVITWLRLSALI